MHFMAISVCVCVCVGCVVFLCHRVVYNNPCPLLKFHPLHSASLLFLLLINLVFCVSSSEMGCVCVRVCVCTHIFTDNQLLFGLSEHSGGAALMGEGLSLLQIWKWPKTCAVALIYCLAFGEIMKLAAAPSIYGHINKFTYDCRHANTNMHISAHSELSAYISIFCSFVSNCSLLSNLLLCLHIWSRELSAQMLSPGSCFLFLKFSVSLHNNLLHYMVTFI